MELHTFIVQMELHTFIVQMELHTFIVQIELHTFIVQMELHKFIVHSSIVVSRSTFLIRFKLIFSVPSWGRNLNFLFLWICLKVFH